MQRLIEIAGLKSGQTGKFSFTRHGIWVQAFLARVRDQYVAFENKCRHIPLSLDYGDNRFFTRDGSGFWCQTHGAVYDPLTGLCTEGPCVGEKLLPVKIAVVDGYVCLVEEDAVNLKCEFLPQ